VCSAEGLVGEPITVFGATIDNKDTSRPDFAAANWGLGLLLAHRPQAAFLGLNRRRFARQCTQKLVRI
jgi:hypothetical protein